VNFLAANFVAHTYNRRARASRETGPHGHDHGQNGSTDRDTDTDIRTETRTQTRTLLSCFASPTSDFRRLAICLAHSFLEPKQSNARNKAKTLISALNGTTATSYMANNAHFNVYWWATCVLQPKAHYPRGSSYPCIVYPLWTPPIVIDQSFGAFMRGIWWYSARGILKSDTIVFYKKMLYASAWYHYWWKCIRKNLSVNYNIRKIKAFSDL